ncbi:hypothetical protein COW36_03250 [bacterium (Candidatus Blackallbacteria) CG17_big_fil_post_rev_8_21_14_2_50_48_46]|uniref:Uncharacterized protein n=1 Tax=bacterium (Candidatus Blackallbacteria) CG17_big_fil_post_rev_8_21_14_2_50_48_46 TaxID=2014261 RepID=A0A2M7G9J7_9BACT|nr:MAG: hypothetical protein COW64_05490 [bacterium (Candidatus Blackallbacteria) CG18_big_fil_WC_8_21_14_2_50_49_26]PIW18807.1 MAG: hypothetical protein COW36_03250 [bacterium (Candidatus Blackallbacteria) CG17_big_fil_post_rev_8_21_14_2_50_48_46]PIW49262.1 MAG: hypothetical protein COW20_06400 [bacterium (Candidatus Blackallbacteria) CG13_big_fil_rev_8_21_14_2_50_49_14]
MSLSPDPAVVMSSTICKHCSLPIPGDLQAKGEEFCCNGCEQVYSILQSAGLGDYYHIRAGSVSIRTPQAAPAALSNYAYLDDPAFTQPERNRDGSKSLEFYLEGVHCAACVWLIEKLPELMPGVISSRLNLSNAIATLTLPPEGKFAPVAAAIERFGYKPYAVKNHREAENLRQRENQRILMRIGVAAFSTGNLMILAVALYSGLEGYLAAFFSWLALLLVIPALTYSAWPFYKEAWHRLRSRQLSIDVPIAFSLLVGFAAGTWQTIQHQGETYFDSLSMLVFLLLLSRYALSRAQQRVGANNQLLSFYEHNVVEVWSETAQAFTSVPVSRLENGARIRVQAGERLPADGVILEGESAIDMSLLTGETYPQPVQAGSRVYAGTRNETTAFVMDATATGDETKMATLLRKTQANLVNRTRIVAMTDLLSRRFVLLVLFASVGLFLWRGLNPESFTRALSLIIISCPCALALATPLVMSLSIQRAFARGYLIKNAHTLEELQDVKTLIFDKTGTLTEGRFQVLQAEALSPEAEDALRALEIHSTHPVALALVRHFASERPLPEVEQAEVLNTGGVQGRIAGHLWQVLPSLNQESELAGGQPVTQLELRCEDTLQGRIWLGDRIREGTHQTLARLRQMGYELVLLSGDQAAPCQRVAENLGIEKVFSRVTPEQKETILKGFEAPVMIGDGVNDIMALSSARIGISVQGGVEENLQTADVHLTETGISQIPSLILHSQKTLSLIKLCLSFSLVYNLASISAAVMGWVTPLFAAVLMPISSLTVVALAVIGGRKL